MVKPSFLTLPGTPQEKKNLIKILANNCCGPVFERVLNKEQFKNSAIVGIHTQKLLFEISENYWYIDNPYFLRDFARNESLSHNSNRYYRVVKNGLYNDGKGDNDPKRFNSFDIKLSEWKTNGEKIVVVPASDFLSKVVGSPNWLQDVLSEIKKYTDRPIEVSHRGINPVNYQDSIWCIVTMSSNVQAEALINGVPVITTHYTKLGSLQDIENPPVEQSREILYNLAQQQWTVKELVNGVWKEILSKHQ